MTARIGAPEEVGDAGAARVAFSRAAVHSAGSGTLRRIQKTRKAGRIADEEHVAGRQVGHQIDGDGGEQDADVDAVWSTAAIHGRQRLGQVSASSDEPTAHSPPMPSAARKRKMRRCHHVVREGREAGEDGVGEDGQAEGAAAAEAIADASEEAAAQRPADEERGLDPRALLAHGGVGGARSRPGAP